MNYFGKEKYKTKVGGFISLILFSLMIWYIVVQAQKLLLKEDPTTTFNELYYRVNEQFGLRMGKDLRYDFGFTIGLPDFSFANYDATYYTPIAQEVVYNVSTPLLFSLGK